MFSSTEGALRIYVRISYGEISLLKLNRIYWAHLISNKYCAVTLFALITHFR